MEKNITLIIMSAGESSRFQTKTKIKKQWLRIDGKPIWLFNALTLQNRFKFKKVIITASKREVDYMRRFCDYEIVEGGDTRAQSLRNALSLVNTEFVMVNDATRINFDFNVLENMLSIAKNEDFDCIIPVINPVDTIFYEENGERKYLNKENTFLVQTPQISKVNALKKALEGGNFSDESSALDSIGGKIIKVRGTNRLDKITYFEDVKRFNLDTKEDLRVGFGFDTHSIQNGDGVNLGGVKIECHKSIIAHSDGDVIIHALCDAILGAIGGGDIGEWFSDKDEKYRNIDSKLLLEEIMDFTQKVGYRIINVDIMLLAEVPKISSYKNAMIDALSPILKIEKKDINIKATTMEKMGFIGRGEGISAMCNATLKYSVNEWSGNTSLR